MKRWMSDKVVSAEKGCWRSGCLASLGTLLSGKEGGFHPDSLVLQYPAGYRIRSVAVQFVSFGFAPSCPL